jgi:hypothetical protein
VHFVQDLEAGWLLARVRPFCAITSQVVLFDHNSRQSGSPLPPCSGSGVYARSRTDALLSCAFGQLVARLGTEVRERLNGSTRPLWVPGSRALRPPHRGSGRN